MRKRYLRHGLWATVLSAVLVLSAQSSQADEWYPGLPDPEFSAAWTAAAQGSLSYAKRAKQWFRSPDAMVTVNVKYDPKEEGEYLYTGIAYMVSPPGAPANYGYLPPITVRSVGFGLIPVEATVQVSQRRENGYPIAATAVLGGRKETKFGGTTGPTNPFVREVMNPTVVDDAFNVQILSVRVDGVDLALTGDCRTVTPAPVHMVGPGYTIQDPDEPGVQEKFFSTADPATFFHPLWGGQLNGTMTIPPFTGCTTASGDDLSALMTLSVSGPGNPLSARVGYPCAKVDGTAAWPLAPGQSTPKSTIADGWVATNARLTGSSAKGCSGTVKFPYPERPVD